MQHAGAPSTRNYRRKWFRLASVSTLMEMGFTQEASEFYFAARIRALRRHSPWSLLLIPFCLTGWLGTWYLLFRLVWSFHHFLYPQHLLAEFWGKGISFTTFVLSLLMLFGPAVGALCFGLAIGNCVVWFVPPARRTLDSEAVNYPGTGFRETTWTLLRLAGSTIPTGMAIAILAASMLRCLR
ncbi:MAG TPA: hypothetical protein VMS18_17610 [Candidatus Binatia bacterium]|nr:hypothetical protein [Candidatus Binatia bacterium]